mmetsp:Transcript_64287/g.135055  ORF Transcript_64287/g.135055 Transcript_64287/m.135055 type:complete len:685 (-) Transcript_64287:65-2119(-)
MTSAGYPSKPAGAMAVVDFAPLLPAPEVNFWLRMTEKKLDELRLDQRALDIIGYYEAPQFDKVPPKVCITSEAFSENPCGFPSGSVPIKGDLKNFNTSEEFREFLKGEARTARITQATSLLREDILSGSALEDPVRLRPMHMVAFADLKKYLFAYTVAFPVLSPPTELAWKKVDEPKLATDAGFSRETLGKVAHALRGEDAKFRDAGAFLLLRSGEAAEWALQPLAALKDKSKLEGAQVALAFVDPAAAEAPSWPLRNLLLAVAHYFPGKWQVLAFRDRHLGEGAETAADVRSVVFSVEVTKEGAEACLASSPPPEETRKGGWSKIQHFDLTAFLDKKRIAADAVDLNVKLMKWRLLPELKPERMKELRVLMLGSGTLGCSVARNLMGWGVRKMTFVDSGKVSLSNPVRQSLFTHQDAADGRSKSLAAAQAVQAVMPDAEVESVQLEIPMPGHPHQNRAALDQAVKKLSDLIDSHDVVCMLTDSRESRWLPSLLVGAAQRRPRREGDPLPPLGMTVALGFDSFLVSRQSYLESPAACYFCNDMNAPADSLAFRTLDQQCTVTRPGLSGLSSSTAVELIAALVQHPDGFAAPYGPQTKQSCLGVVPHQVRGYVADYRLSPAETEPFKNCICCSQGVMERYEEEGLEFIARIVTNSAELEKISGLQAMQAAVREDDVLAFDEFDDF